MTDMRKTKKHSNFSNGTEKSPKLHQGGIPNIQLLSKNFSQALLDPASRSALLMKNSNLALKTVNVSPTRQN